MDVFPAFALPIMRTRNWTFGIRRRGCCVSIGATTEYVSVGATTEDVSVGATTEDVPVGATTEDVSVGATTEDMSVGATTEDVSVGAMTEESSIRVTMGRRTLLLLSTVNNRTLRCFTDSL
jgi:hypothetical protein